MLNKNRLITQILRFYLMINDCFTKKFKNPNGLTVSNILNQGLKKQLTVQSKNYYLYTSKTASNVII